jgi:hypothetical protein
MREMFNRMAVGFIMRSSRAPVNGLNPLRAEEVGTQPYAKETHLDRTTRGRALPAGASKPVASRG